jgi:hypothetical protein
MVLIVVGETGVDGGKGVGVGLGVVVGETGVDGDRGVGVWTVEVWDCPAAGAEPGAGTCSDDSNGNGSGKGWVEEAGEVVAVSVLEEVVMVRSEEKDAERVVEGEKSGDARLKGSDSRSESNEK